MPPQRGGGGGGGGLRKRKSSASTRSNTNTERKSGVDVAQAQFPLPPTFVSTKTGETPVNSPIIDSAMKKKMVLTQAQKQALIDNLQLEITERARKLRAQYALQAQGLRARLELRIHRIPVGLRKLKVSDLLEKYEQRDDKNKATTHGILSPAKLSRQRPSPGKRSEAVGAKAQMLSPQRPAKRPSTEMDALVVDDKENIIHEASPARKRLRTSAQEKANTADGMTASPRRQMAPSHVLSPKSNNSRTLPQSPFKSPVKPSISSRPVSPLKPSISVPTASSLAKLADRPPTAAGRPVTRVNSVKSNPRAASRAGAAPKARAVAPKSSKKAVGTTPSVAVVIDDSEEEPKRNSSSSEMTNASARTTIVTKTTTTKRTAAPKAAIRTGTTRSTSKPAATVTKEKKTTSTLMGTLAKGKKAAMAAATATAAATTKSRAAREKPITKPTAAATASTGTGRTLRKRV